MNKLANLFIKAFSIFMFIANIWKSMGKETHLMKSK